MEIGLDFATGLSQGVAWPWPIAVYLFLAGISGGAVAIAIAVNLFKGVHSDTPAMKAAALTGFVTIVLGMVCLVCDLTNPLNFWRILIYYNPTSVMSLGVMALLFYIPLVFLLMLVTLKDVPALKCLAPITGIIAKFRAPLDWIVLILAVTICAYTGFLISALIRFPLINTSVLPALFVASGFSAGLAAIKLIGAGCFGEKTNSGAMHALHLAEWPIMTIEALCIFMIAVALISGNAAAKEAASAFCTGVWAQVFWVGAIGIGFCVPLVLNFVKSLRESIGVFYLSALCSIGGMMCLRLFILYAGQLNPM